MQLMALAEFKIVCKERRAMTKSSKRSWPCVDNGAGRCSVCGTTLADDGCAFVPPAEYAPPSMKATVLAWLAGRPRPDGSYRSLAPCGTAGAALAASASAADTATASSSAAAASSGDHPGSAVTASSVTEREVRLSDDHEHEASDLSPLHSKRRRTASADSHHRAPKRHKASGTSNPRKASGASKLLKGSSKPHKASRSTSHAGKDEPAQAAAAAPSTSSSSSQRVAAARSLPPEVATSAAASVAPLCDSSGRPCRARKPPVKLYYRLFKR